MHLNNFEWAILVFWFTCGILSWGFRTGYMKNKITSIDDEMLLAYLMIVFDLLGPISLIATAQECNFKHWAWIPNKTDGEKMLEQLVKDSERTVTVRVTDSAYFYAPYIPLFTRSSTSTTLKNKIMNKFQQFWNRLKSRYFIWRIKKVYIDEHTNNF